MGMLSRFFGGPAKAGPTNSADAGKLSSAPGPAAAASAPPAAAPANETAEQRVDRVLPSLGFAPAPAIKPEPPIDQWIAKFSDKDFGLVLIQNQHAKDYQSRICDMTPAFIQAITANAGELIRPDELQQIRDLDARWQKLQLSILEFGHVATRRRWQAMLADDTATAESGHDPHEINSVADFEKMQNEAVLRGKQVRESLKVVSRQAIEVWTPICRRACEAARDWCIDRYDLEKRETDALSLKFVRSCGFSNMGSG